MFRPIQPVLAVAAVLPVAAGFQSAQAESHLMRLADVSHDQIVFTYENDLWIVPIEGGDARRITNHPGTEMWARFSPDGKWIAFTGQYDGGQDVYVMEARGGVPRRLTYHPALDRVLDWWPDGKWVLFRSNRDWPQRGEEIYRVSIEGGMPERLPVDRAGLAAVSPDGKLIAYNRITREERTWKRYAGGMAQDIWLGSLERRDYRVVADSDYTSNFPMWHGNDIYFTSDREDGTLNLYKYDVAGGQVTRLTHYKDYDVKYPAIGPEHIVYQYGESLYLYELSTGRTWQVPVGIASDLVHLRPEFVEVRPTRGSFRLSPGGKRLLLEARGEILNLPVKDGEPINLTQSPGSREKNAAWSPDGRWIAFISDQTGEEEIFLVDQERRQAPRQLTRGGLGFRLQLEWSPDSRHLLFADKFLRLNLVDAETGEIAVVDQGEYDDAWERWGIQDYVWSPDSRWIAYTKFEQSFYESVFLYSLEQRRSYRVTGDMTQDWSPSFDPKGRYLYFLSNRTFNPVMGFVDQNHVFLDMARPYIAILKDGELSPFYPKQDVEEVVETDPADARPKSEDDRKDADAQTAASAVQVDVENIGRRMVVAEGVPAGNYFRLEATQDGFLYLKREGYEFSKYQSVTDQTGGQLDLYHYNLDKHETTKLMSGIANYHLSADGKKLVYRAGSTYGVVDVGSKASVGDGKVDLGGVKLLIDRQQEFAQMFAEAWRIQRDWFYDPNMHGVDWNAMREKYGRFVPFCGNRGDLNYLIGEMIAELSIGHTYVWGGDLEDTDYHVPTGLLGAELATEKDSPFYRIAHIIPGTPGDPRERSPLDEPGCPIRAGHYLIAIDGAELRVSDNPYAFLQNKADTVVTLTYNDRPSVEGARSHRVRTLSSEWPIRYREWVEQNRAHVDKTSGGQIGYVHIPDMGENGLIEFAKYWYPQYTRKAMIVDARYNGGGFTGDMIIDRLERQLWGLTKPREGKVLRDPEQAFYGPWVVLINEDTGSNGEMFAEAIKIRQLAPVIGMRTWGGAIGIEPHQDLVDGGTVTPPQFGLYGLDGRWLIEGRGVEPDIEVQNLPGDVLRGEDKQLDEGLSYLMELLATCPPELPSVPAYPDKSKK